MGKTSFSLGLSLILASSAAHAVPPEDPELFGSRAGTRLSLGVRLRQGSEQREYGGYVALAVPLERLAMPRKVAQAEPDDGDPEQPGEPTKAPVPQGPSARTAPPARPAIAARAFVELSRRSVQRALDAAGSEQKRRELEELAARARGSAALPELRLRAARSNDQALRLTPTPDDPYRYTLADGSDLTLEATATWRLDRLLFADEEVALARLGVERDKLLALLVQKTLARLFAWRRALSRSRDQSLSAEERAEAELELLEATAELDVLTDGWFGAESERLGLFSALEPAASEPDARGDERAAAAAADPLAVRNAGQSAASAAGVGEAAEMR